jgi:hypothetical protein
MVRPPLGSVWREMGRPPLGSGSQSSLALAESKEAEEARASSPLGPCLRATVETGQERFICGEVRNWPWRVLVPSESDLRHQLPVGTEAVRLLPQVREQTFLGRVSFVVPVRHADQLELIQGWVERQCAAVR